MKNKIQFVAILAIALLSASCKKDKENQPTQQSPNAFSFDGKEYKLSNAFKEYYGILDSNTAQGQNFDLTFVSDGITIKESNGSIDSIVGRGNIVYFELFTDNVTDLKNGTYTLDTVNTRPGTFDIGEVLFNTSYETDSIGDLQRFVSGSLNYTNTSGNQTITFTGKTAENKTISGFYKGTIKTYDVSDNNLGAQRLKIYKSTK